VQSGRVEVQGLRVETRFISGGPLSLPIAVLFWPLVELPLHLPTHSHATTLHPWLRILATVAMASKHFFCLRLPARADVAASLAQRDQQDVHHKRKLRGQREGSVLDPCRLALRFKLAPGGNGEGTRVLQLIAHLPAAPLACRRRLDACSVPCIAAASKPLPSLPHCLPAHYLHDMQAPHPL